MTAGVSRFGRREFLKLGGAPLVPSAWAVAAPRRAGAAPLTRVRFGVESAIAYNPVDVAKEKGFLEEEGLGVEFLWAQAALEVIQATIDGSAEGGVGSRRAWCG
jgi:ABC-type nitrate/sulfonate/bicarbonate transport system substrate-binding protein